MEREQQNIVEELRNKGIEVYSFSRLECINHCLYEAYNTYILDKRTEQIPNIYSVLGGRIHDVLENIMNDNAKKEDLIDAMNQELEDMNMLGIEFPKTKDGNDSIRQGWISDMTNFCSTYKKPEGEFETETFFLYKTPNGHYLQGFIDLLRKNKDDSISIYDYKTSSMYKGEEIKKHGRQLVLYALGKEQQGFKVKSISWIMLKYVEVSYIGKKRSNCKEESRISKIIERKNIVKELIPVIEYKLHKYGIDEIDIEVIIEEAKQRNKIPEILACEFTIKPYVMRYELNDEIRTDCNNYLDETIEKWESLKKDKKNYPPLNFTRTKKIITKDKDGREIETEKIIEDCFYCYSLCGYSKSCSHFQRYLDTKQKTTQDDNLW